MTRVVIQFQLKWEILFLLRFNQNSSLIVAYHGPYRVYEVTGTNFKVKLVSTPDVGPTTISLQQVSKYKGNLLATFLDLYRKLRTI